MVNVGFVSGKGKKENVDTKCVGIRNMKGKNCNWIMMLLVSLLVGCTGKMQDCVFSVSDDKQVVFAPGNLAEDGRGFVSHQWEYGGLFGWGTGDRLADTSDNWQDYTHFVEWGDNVAGGWRTLTGDEWHYLLFERVDADVKRAVGTVNGMKGLFLLPDEWVLPLECSFVSQAKGWNVNVYSVSQWEQMENAGAVFLPAAGFRWGEVSYSDGCQGLYWSSTARENGCPYTMHFDGSILSVDWDNTPHFGQSVRLVRVCN